MIYFFPVVYPPPPPELFGKLFKREGPSNTDPAFPERTPLLQEVRVPRTQEYFSAQKIREASQMGSVLSAVPKGVAGGKEL